MLLCLFSYGFSTCTLVSSFSPRSCMLQPNYKLCQGVSVSAIVCVCVYLSSRWPKDSVSTGGPTNKPRTHSGCKALDGSGVITAAQADLHTHTPTTKIYHSTSGIIIICRSVSQKKTHTRNLDVFTRQTPETASLILTELTLEGAEVAVYAWVSREQAPRVSERRGGHEEKQQDDPASFIHAWTCWRIFTVHHFRVCWHSTDSNANIIINNDDAPAILITLITLR